MAIIRKIPLALAFAATCFITACATPVARGPQGNEGEIAAESTKQKALVIEQYMTETVRANKVAAPILRANHALCARQGYRTGALFWSTESFNREYASIARDQFGLTKTPTIMFVTPNTPSQKAGLKAGDVIRAVNGIAIEDDDDMQQALTKVTDGKYELLVDRKGTARPVRMTGVPVCDYPVNVDFSDYNVNAYADGQSIKISRGMMRFANDNELAVVIGHELAHNNMDHRGKKTQNTSVGMGIGLVFDLMAAANGVSTNFTNDFGGIGAQAYSVEFEQEADYVGLYLTARAGYPIGVAPHFWRRMAAEESADAIDTGGSHPTTPQRFVALEKATAEINAKKKAGKALRPDIPEAPAQQAPQKKKSFN